MSGEKGAASLERMTTRHLLPFLFVGLLSACGAAPAEADPAAVAVQPVTQPVTQGAPAACPDAADPTVWYLSRDVATCAAALFTCGSGQTSFSDGCGCGCLGPSPAQPATCPAPTAPGVHYVSQDPRKCAAAFYRCEDHQRPIDEACGCGCLD
jgi:hypothetical protein